MAQIIHPFPPIAGEGARALILGTMPSKRSIECGYSYAHPQNAFWRIIYSAFDNPPDEEIEKRFQFLIAHKLALWDVLSSCDREGSLDSDITNPIPNDINGLLIAYPTISKLIFNGNNAYMFYKRLIGVPTIEWYILPSTSPANATIPFVEKCRKWSAVLSNL